ncbi:Homoserine kinase, partial [Dissostichus eleginoides]
RSPGETALALSSVSSSLSSAESELSLLGRPSVRTDNIQPLSAGARGSVVSNAGTNLRPLRDRLCSRPIKDGHSGVM